MKIVSLAKVAEAQKKVKGERLALNRWGEELQGNAVAGRVAVLEER